MTTAMLLSAEAVVTLDGQDRIYRPGYVIVEGTRIAHVGEGEPGAADASDGRVDLGSRLLMPGLVNSHTHTPMVLFRGLAEGHSLFTLEGWYQGVRVWEELLDPDWIAPAVAVSCAEMIRTGTTCFADQYFHMDRVAPVVARSGMRAALAYGIVELGDDAARAREIAAAEAFLRTLDSGGRLRGWIGPHAFFVDNTPDAIERELVLADRYGTGFHVHLATSGEEDRHCRERYGHGAIAELEALGVLDRRVVAAHCITLGPEDFPILAGKPFTAVICASACMRSGAEAAPATAMSEAGVDLAIGTDNVANNNSYDLFGELRTAAKLMSFREGRPDAIPAREILRMATEGGARALGLEEEIGSLEIGKQADLIALDLSEIGWAPRVADGLYTSLVYAASGMHVTDVMVGGEWLFTEGAWTTIDRAAAVAELEVAHAQLRRSRAQREPGNAGPAALESARPSGG